MLRFLFRRLTSRPERGRALFDGVVAEARRPHWYVEGEIADSLDGRFAVLATICALFIVRLESGSGAGDAASAALTERFIESMDSEHRELGLNDPGLGRRVRKLVGSLERRVDEWRDAIHGETGWDETVVSSLYRGEPPKDEALDHSSKALTELWKRLSESLDETLVEGRVG
jgi:cytochrome b pre-mRNA-processing protein 3